MATQGQLFYFLASLFLGFLGGFFWEIFSLIKLPFPKGKVKNIATIVIDCLYFVLFGVVCALFSAHYSFPDHRVYRYIAYAIGFIIYLKSVKILLDFLKKVCYNRLTKLLRVVSARKKGKEKV